MSKHLQMLLLVVVLTMPWATQAQVTSATFRTGVDTARWITLGDHAVTLSFTDVDDGVCAVQDIGFPFFFGHDFWSQLICNTNGRLRLGTWMSTDRTDMPFAAGAVANDLPKIVPYGKDLCVRTYVGHYVKCELTGTAPHRVFVIETRQSNGYRGSDASVVKYQVQLHEDSSKLVLLYGINTGTVGSAQIGIAASAGDVLTVNAATHVAAAGATSATSRTWPGEGRYYEFQPLLPTCMPPAWTAEVIDVSAHTATLQWNGAADNYVVEYAPSDFTPGTSAGTVVPVVASHSCTLTGLAPNTQYHVYLHGDCGAGDTSFNIGTVFATDCSPVLRGDMPYQDYFSVQSSHSTMPECWNRAYGGLDGFPYKSNMYGRSSLVFKYDGDSSSTAITPEIEMAADSLELVFEAYKGSAYYSGRLVVGVMDDPQQDSTFVPVDTLTLTALSEWTEMEVPLTSYAGTGHYVAIRYCRAPGSGDVGFLALSKMQILPYTACRRPTMVYANAITHESAQVQLRADADTAADGYMLYYGTVDNLAAATDSVRFTGRGTLLSGLHAQTTYYGWVRTQCGGEDSRTRAFSFTTLCPCMEVNELESQVSTTNRTALLSWFAPAGGFAVTATRCATSTKKTACGPSPRRRTTIILSVRWTATHATNIR